MPYKPVILLDETFHQTFFSSYKATVLLSEKQITIAFIDYIRKKYIYFFSQQSDESFDATFVRKIFEEQNIDEKNFKIRFLIATPNVQILPKSFHKAENEQLATGFVFNDNVSTIIRCPSLYDSVLLCSLPGYLGDVLQNFSSSQVFPHMHASLHLANLHLRKNRQKSEVFIHFNESFFEAMVIDNERLVLSNTYSYQHFDDVMYYIHLLYKTLSLNAEKFPLVFSGQIEKKDELIKKAKDFSFNVDYARLNHAYIYSYRFNELTAHRYATLFSIPYENY